MSAATDRINRVGELAERLAPAFRDKLDFSKNEDYAALAEYAWLAADAVVKKQETMLAAQVEKERVEAKDKTEREAKK